METDGRERLYKNGLRGQLWCRSDITATVWNVVTAPIKSADFVGIFCRL